jgi:hypothetical protein
VCFNKSISNTENKNPGAARKEDSWDDDGTVSKGIKSNLDYIFRKEGKEPIEVEIQRHVIKKDTIKENESIDKKHRT